MFDPLPFSAQILFGEPARMPIPSRTTRCVSDSAGSRLPSAFSPKDRTLGHHPSKVVHHPNVILPGHRGSGASGGKFPPSPTVGLLHLEGLSNDQSRSDFWSKAMALPQRKGLSGPKRSSLGVQASFVCFQAHVGHTGEIMVPWLRDVLRSLSVIAREPPLQ